MRCVGLDDDEDMACSNQVATGPYCEDCKTLANTFLEEIAKAKAVKKEPVILAEEQIMMRPRYRVFLP